MSSTLRTGALPHSSDAFAPGLDAPLTDVAQRVSSPTRPYLRRLSGVLRSRPELVLGPPIAPVQPARVAPAPSAPQRPARNTPISRSSLDPWEAAAAAISEEQLDALTSALHLTLSLLVESHPNDPGLVEAKRAVATFHVRGVVREARDHEARERWLPASRAWMRAAVAAGDDPWLFAHAARTLLFTNASSQDTRELVGRALDLDPNNPLACQVLDRVIG